MLKSSENVNFWENWWEQQYPAEILKEIQSKKAMATTMMQ